MIPLKQLKDLLEAKQVGTIYHFTKLENFHDLLHQERPFEMGSMNGETISATRNGILPLKNKTFENHNVRIALDGDKISENHKVRPVLGLKDDEKDIFNHRHNDKYRVHRDSGEAEEAIVKHPFNIKPYIQHVHIIKNRDTDDMVENHILPELDKHEIPYSHTKSYSLTSLKEEFTAVVHSWFEELEINL